MKKLFVFLMVAIIAVSASLTSCKKEISRERVYSKGLVTSRIYVPMTRTTSIVPNGRGGVSIHAHTSPSVYSTTVYIQDLDREINIGSCSFYEKTKLGDAVELEYTLIRFDDGSFKIKDTELIN